VRGKDPSACWVEIRKRVQLARAQLVSALEDQEDKDRPGEEALGMDLEAAEGLPHAHCKTLAALEEPPAVAGGQALFEASERRSSSLRMLRYLWTACAGGGGAGCCPMRCSSLGGGRGQGMPGEV